MQSSKQGTFTYPLGWHQLDLRLLTHCGREAKLGDVLHPTLVRESYDSESSRLSLASVTQTFC